MAHNTHPRVSIGMAVFNGGNYIREAIDSILAQTYEDFELIISDNASTDNTEDIVRAYAARDRRVRYYRNEHNVGLAKNYNLVFQLATGEYFKWAAHDDVVAPEFLAKCIEVLDRDHDVVLCQARAKIIDEDGRVIGEDVPTLRTDSPRPRDRFIDVIQVSHSCHPQYGVVRARTLALTSLMGNYPASDRVLLARLALFGRFHEIPEGLFFARRHATQSLQAHANRYALTAFYDPAKRDKIIFPKWRILAGFWGALAGAPVSWVDRACCHGYMAKWTGHNLPALVSDLTTAGKMVLLRSRAIKDLVTAAKRSRSWSDQ
jgi:glycosyltransferase involved in cell wall biosynthesis